MNVMDAGTVEKTIKDNLNSGLVNSTVNVKNPVATIGRQSQERIDGLITAAENLVGSVKPRRPLLNLTINEGKTIFWFGIGLSTFYMLLTVVTIILANKTVKAMQEDLQNLPSYWADRAYQAAALRDYRNPGIEYQRIYSLFMEDPENAKEEVESLESGSKRYQQCKNYIISLIQEKDPRDILVLDWGKNNGEKWCIYRFFDEETDRFLHVWPDGKVEETTDNAVTDLYSAHRYSKRKIWTVIREAPTEKTQ